MVNEKRYFFCKYFLFMQIVSNLKCVFSTAAFASFPVLQIHLTRTSWPSAAQLFTFILCHRDSTTILTYWKVYCVADTVWNNIHITKYADDATCVHFYLVLSLGCAWFCGPFGLVHLVESSRCNYLSVLAKQYCLLYFSPTLTYHIHTHMITLGASSSALYCFGNSFRHYY